MLKKTLECQRCEESIPCSFKSLFLAHGEVIITNGASRSSFKAEWFPSGFDIETDEAFRLLINYCFHRGNHNKWFANWRLTKITSGKVNLKIKKNESTFASCGVVLCKISHRNDTSTERTIKCRFTFKLNVTRQMTLKFRFMQMCNKNKRHIQIIRFQFCCKHICEFGFGKTSLSTILDDYLNQRLSNRGPRTSRGPRTMS